MSNGDKKRIRVILPADQLREMIAQHPEIEIEVLKNAIPQVTEEMKRRAVNHIVEHIVERAKGEIAAVKWQPNSAFAKMLDELIIQRISDEIMQRAVKASEEHIGKRVDEWWRKHETKISEIITKRITNIIDTLIKFKEQV